MIEEKESPRVNTLDLREQLEETVEEIFSIEGFSTSHNVRFVDEKGEKSEIDMLAKRQIKGNEEIVVAIECKNFNSSAAFKKIRDFKYKLDGLKIKNGLVVVDKDLSQEALKWAIDHHLEVWNSETVRNKYWEAQISRLGKGKAAKFEYCLPLSIDFEKATDLTFDNNSKITTINPKLISRPFYKVFYTINCFRIDPGKKKWTIKDSGYYVVDGLSGEVLGSKGSPQKAKDNKFRGFSGDSEGKIKREEENDVFSEELEQDVIKGFSIPSSKDFNIIKYPFQHDEEDINELITAKIIKDYTRDVEYKVNQDEPKDDARSFQIKPSAEEINLKIQLVYANKWDIEFESRGFRCIRTISANSGRIIFDNLRFCNDKPSLAK
jgi:hypothetical protein